MSDLINQLSEMGADSGYNMTEEHNKLVRQFEEAKHDVMRVRLPETAYAVGDKVIVPGLQNADIQLRCETAGTTASGEISGGYQGIKAGDVINDGSVSWAVVNTYTIPDTPESPVASVNGKKGDVVLTADNVGALPTSHNEDENAHGKMISKHKAEKASTAELGHVKVDGDTIEVSADGTINASKLKTDMYARAKANLENVTEPVQAFKDMSIAWGMPDYSAGTTISELPFTAPCDGVALITGVVGNGYFTLFVNGKSYSSFDVEYSAVKTTQIYLCKGDIVTVTAVSAVIPYVNTDRDELSVFYPLKGANK